MRIETTPLGDVVNTHADDAAPGDWYPDDTCLRSEDSEGEEIGHGPLRVSRHQPDGWEARSGRAWDSGQWVLVDGTRPIAGLRAAMRARIDAVAGEVRDQYITTTPGQEGTYLLKREQALAYQAAGGPPDAAPYPMVRARAEAYGETPAQAAAVILRRAQLWALLGALIETRREAGKRQVALAEDELYIVAAAETAMTALTALAPTNFQIVELWSTTAGATPGTLEAHRQ
jgi:hypothetical protein